MLIVFNWRSGLAYTQTHTYKRKEMKRNTKTKTNKRKGIYALRKSDHFDWKCFHIINFLHLENICYALWAGALCRFLNIRWCDDVIWNNYDDNIKVFGNSSSTFRSNKRLDLSKACDLFFIEVWNAGVVSLSLSLKRWKMFITIKFAWMEFRRTKQLKTTIFSLY